MGKLKAMLQAAGLGWVAFSLGRVVFILIYVALYLILKQVAPDQGISPLVVHREIFWLSNWLLYWLWGIVAGVVLYFTTFVRPQPPLWQWAYALT